MSEEERPSNAGFLMGIYREGLTDLQDFVLNPWQEQIATNDALGTIGHPTQAQVTQDIGNVYGHHEDPHLPPIQPYEPGIEPELEIEIE